MTSAVIPWGDKLHLFGRDILLQATDIDIGFIVYFWCSFTRSLRNHDWWLGI